MKLKIRFEVFKKDQFTCRYCGKRPGETVLEVDHIIPRSKGGTDAIENLVTSCFECNRGKSNRMLHELSPEMQHDAQLLKEKKEQLKEFYKYQKDIETITNRAVTTISNYWFKLTAKQNALSAMQKVSIKNFLKTFTVPEIKEAMEISTKIFDFNQRFKYLCGIIVNKRMKKDDPELHDLVRYWNTKLGRKIYYKREGLEVLLKGRESSGHHPYGLEGSKEIIDIVFSKRRQSYYVTLVDYLNGEKYINDEVDEYWKEQDEEKEKHAWTKLQQKNEAENLLLYQALSYFTYLFKDYSFANIVSDIVNELIHMFGISDTIKMIEYAFLSEELPDRVLYKLQEKDTTYIKKYESWLEDGYKNYLALCAEAREIKENKDVESLKRTLLILSKKFPVEKAKDMLWYAMSKEGKLDSEVFKDLDLLYLETVEEQESMQEFSSKKS